MKETKEAQMDALLRGTDVYNNGIAGIAVGGESIEDEMDVLTMALLQRAEILLRMMESLKRGWSLDGLIAAAIVNNDSIRGESNRRLKLDQWKYNSRGANQSYETLRSGALWSETLVKKLLDASNVHFLMFQSGSSKIDCLRFNFAFRSDYTGDPDGNPVDINADLFSHLQLSGWEDVTVDKLKIHAQRLEAIQHALVEGAIPGRLEKETQALFQHFLTQLVNILPNGDEYRVNSVTGMEPVEVTVEVSNAYLKAQKKDTKSGSTGKRFSLTAETDLVVVPAGLARKTTKDQFRECVYHIQMKDAGMLKNSSTKAKSQLIAESLAKFLDADKEKVKTVCSVLCDGYSLCIMIHFTEEKIALLSHRETEPGRMVALLVWLHHFSTSGEDFTLERFRKKFEGSLIQVGGNLEDEMCKCIDQNRDKDRNLEGGGPKKKRATPKGEHGSSGRKVAQRRSDDNDDDDDDDDDFRLDTHASDRMEMKQKRAEQLSMFSAFMNYRVHGDPLPATAGMVKLLEKETEGKASPYESRLALAGMGGPTDEFQEID